MMKLWRCTNCEDKPGMPGHDFAADSPVCDLCGTDGRVPPGNRVIVPRVVVHFEPPSKVYGVGTGVIACNGKPTLVGGVRSSGETNAVTCPKCQATTIYNETKARESYDPAFAIPEDDNGAS